ncbi:zinc-ribbon domain-containing protein [bacterium]|nr:zinc-ribbon domain-containing protein [bacterium]
MFIQCQHCHTTYKIDENKLPLEKSVVRCAKCSEPIPLNREKQVELLKSSPKMLVKCNECGTQYSVPLGSIKKKSTKVKCGKCGNFFEISTDSETSYEEEEELSHDYSEEYEENDIDLDNIDIPAESEIEVDNLFDNLGDNGEKNGEEPDDANDTLTSKSANDEYFESVNLGEDEDDLLDGDLEIDEISKDKKYNIFLKPNIQSTGKTTGTEEKGDSWPEIQDETFVDDDLEIDQFTDLNDIKDVPAKTKKKPAKKDSLKKPKKRRGLLWLLWILIVFALGVVGWLFFDFKSEMVYTSPQTEMFDTQSKIAILEPLNGKFIKNKNFANRLFVLEGKLLNVYNAKTIVSRIELEGFLYTDDNEQPFVSTSYAGMILGEDNLKEWNREQIESELMKQAQTSEELLEFGSDDLIDFQIVFFKTPNPKSIQKLGAKIKQFSKRSL